MFYNLVTRSICRFCIETGGKDDESMCHLPNDFWLIYEPVHEISNYVVYATSKASDQPAHTHSLIRVFATRLNIL